MTPRHPKVSIVIPLYNHENFIREAVQSVLHQSFSDLELIVINDGSTDSSEDVIKGIQDERLTYLSQKNEGAPKAINRGIHLARGQYVGILNSDDVYHIHRLEEALKVLEADRSLAAVFSHVECIDRDGKLIRVVRGLEENWKGRDTNVSLKGTTDVAIGLLAGNCLLTTSNLVCRKSVFDEIGYFREFRYAHDYDFFLRVSSRFGATIIEAPLLRYRIHEANTVKENEAEVSFEIGLILAHFLSTNKRDLLFGQGKDCPDALVKAFNSLDTRNTDRMIMVLLLFGLRHQAEVETLFEELMRNREHPLRRQCIESLRSHIDLWRSAQDAWKMWSDANDRLTQYQSSVIYRFWRATTWPARKLFGRASLKPEGTKDL